MAVPVIVDTVALILLEGIKLFSSERQRALNNEHAEAIQDLQDAQNRVYPEYNKVDIVKAKQRLEKFHLAYLSAQRELVQQKAGA